jgi:hypothetical protein
MGIVEKLCQLPIYRLLLKPETYLIENNLNVSLTNLINQLPNHNNINHIQLLNHRDEEYIEMYYTSNLLIETKVFCKTLLKEAKINKDEYFEMLKKNELSLLFEILEKNKLPFFKKLIIHDLQRFNLGIGRMINQIENSLEFEEVISILKSYHMIDKYVNQCKREIL